jgi:hypothetical protein
MNKSTQRDQLATLLFGLTDESVQFRNKWRGFAGAVIWLTLSGLTALLTLIGAQGRTAIAILIGMSLVKYIPLLAVVYSLSRKMAAHYLDDVYELNNEDLAAGFLEEVTFGYGREKITINEGNINAKDERSSLILIGGPGAIQVNLDSVALLEKVNGEPAVIYPRKAPWKLGRFERIREIGRLDEVGKREYAIINLRDQFIEGLSVKSRTKDGMLIEAQDIKVMFSVSRRQDAKSDDIQGDAFLFDERAVQALVYNQAVATPEAAFAPAGIAFPWDTTVVPLVTSELERLITSHTLNEILANISQKETDAASTNDQTIAQMRVELTGQQAPSGTRAPSPAPNFESRSKITEQFFGKSFKDKAASLGIFIEWVDIGAWIPSDYIFDKHKEAWKLSLENAKLRGKVERSKGSYQTKEIINLINSVVVSNYDKSSSARSFSFSGSSGGSGDKDELDRMENMLSNNPELKANLKFMHKLHALRDQPSGHRSPSRKGNVIAHEMLKAFRKELIAAKNLIVDSDGVSAEEKNNNLNNIDKALHDISALLPPHWVGSKS